MPLEDERDYPELNKCPECETFFADLTCPLCGRLCPEGMRAGNRRPIKQKKHAQYERHGSGRVQFVPWYFSLWFIILMLFVQQIVGLVLLWASPQRRWVKILLTVLTVMPFFLLYAFGGVSMILSSIFAWTEKPPVNLTVSQKEYVELCLPMDVVAVYRTPEEYAEDYVTATFTVEAVYQDEWAYDASYPDYIVCKAEAEGKSWVFLLHDYRQGTASNLTAGDEIRIWGEVSGKETIANGYLGTLTAPCINIVYLEIME